MSNVRPDELVKWQPVSGNGWWLVSTRAGAAEWGTEESRNPQPLTQDDLERVATLAMLAPGTRIEGLGEVLGMFGRSDRVLFHLQENSKANKSVGLNLSDTCRTQLE